MGRKQGSKGQYWNNNGGWNSNGGWNNNGWMTQQQHVAQSLAAQLDGPVWEISAIGRMCKVVEALTNAGIVTTSPHPQSQTSHTSTIFATTPKEPTNAEILQKFKEIVEHVEKIQSPASQSGTISSSPAMSSTDKAQVVTSEALDQPIKEAYMVLCIHSDTPFAKILNHRICTLLDARSLCRFLVLDSASRELAR